MQVSNISGDTFSNADLLNKMEEKLVEYNIELRQELLNILGYWMRETPDEINRGFIGRIDHDGKVYPEAPKGSVLNSRILWSFSAGYNLTGKSEYLEMAARAFEYLSTS